MEDGERMDDATMMQHTAIHQQQQQQQEEESHSGSGSSGSGSTGNVKGVPSEGAVGTVEGAHEVCRAVIGLLSGFYFSKENLLEGMLNAGISKEYLDQYQLLPSSAELNFKKRKEGPAGGLHTHKMRKAEGLPELTAKGKTPVTFLQEYCLRMFKCKPVFETSVQGIAIGLVLELTVSRGQN